MYKVYWISFASGFGFAFFVFFFVLSWLHVGYSWSEQIVACALAEVLFALVALWVAFELGGVQGQREIICLLLSNVLGAVLFWFLPIALVGLSSFNPL
jgi:hypothetical protein